MTLTRPDHRAPEFAHATVRRIGWLLPGLTYAAMYMARYNFPLRQQVAAPTPTDGDKAQVGARSSRSATLVYGISALFNGPIADRFGGRRAMLDRRLRRVRVFNLAVRSRRLPRASSAPAPLLLGYLATVWTLNMYFQSYSALALIKVNSGWFHVSERGVFSAIFGSMIQSGRVPGVPAARRPPVVVALPWQWKFFLPAVIVGADGGAHASWWCATRRPTPGSPPFDPQDATSGDTEKITLGYVARRCSPTRSRSPSRSPEFCTGAGAQGLRAVVPALHAGGAAPGRSTTRSSRGTRSPIVAAPASPARSSPATLSDWVFGRAARRWRSSATRSRSRCLVGDLAGRRASGRDHRGVHRELARDLDGALDAVGHRLDGLRRQARRRHRRRACSTACSTSGGSFVGLRHGAAARPLRLGRVGARA